MKYKVGDKVILGTDGASCGGKDKFVGKVATIGRVNTGWCDLYPYIMTPDNGYAWCDDELTPVNEFKIVITVDGNETLARLYDGNKVIKSASAKCSPEDTFDFSLGVKLAFERLMGVEPKNEEKPNSEPKSKKYEVGQKYSVKGVFYSKGGFIEITKVEGDEVTWKTLRGMEDWGATHTFGVGSAFDDRCTLVKTMYKPGDKVKITGEICGHFSNIGDVITLTDDKVDQSLNPKNSHKWHYEENVGYICEDDIEPYVEPEFKVGDLVKITHAGHRYSTYHAWLEKNAPDYITKFKATYMTPTNDEVGVIRKIALHEMIPSDGDCCLVEFSRNRVILINHLGIEKV